MRGDIFMLLQAATTVYSSLEGGRGKGGKGGPDIPERSLSRDVWPRRL